MFRLGAVTQGELQRLVQSRVHEALIECCPVLLVGSGLTMGAPYNMPGMGELGSRIVDALRKKPRVDPGLVTTFATAVADMGYERAINAVPGMDALAGDVIEIVRGEIDVRDLSAYENLVANRPATGLSTFLRKRTQGTNPPLVVLTTNYDRIIEYECGLLGLTCHSGFGGGYISEFTTTFPGRPRRRANCSFELDLYKIHGSLGWYMDAVGKHWRLPLTRSPLPGFKPVMIVPGDEKFEATHQGIYRKLMTASEPFVREARSLFVVGYGFNDAHIHEPLFDGTSREARPQPIVILGRTMTEACKSFIKTARRHLVLERWGTMDTRVHCDELLSPEILADKSYWDLNHLVELL